MSATTGVEVHSDEDERLVRRVAVALCDDGAMYGNGTLRFARRAVDFFDKERPVPDVALFWCENRQGYFTDDGSEWSPS